jgi:hypothetical protein
MRIANDADQFNSFPPGVRLEQRSGLKAVGAVNMSAINIPSMTQRRATAHRRIGASVLRTAVRTLLSEGERRGECDWRRLNSRWLADIGETSAGAEASQIRFSALRDAPGGPFGFTGNCVAADRLRLYAFWRSPLG